jgi:hypothetical protein
MKSAMTLLGFFLAVSLSLSAQITIDNSTFPAEGDTLENSLDLDGSDLDLKTAGADISWDFRSLSADEEVDVVILDAADGRSYASFPDADLVAFLASANTERYLKVSSSEVNEIGFAGIDPVLQQIFLSTEYSQEYTIQVAPLNYEDMGSYSTTMTSQFPYDSLPQDIKDILGAFRPDSFRVEIEVERTDHADAWGNLSIPGGDYEVLRNHSMETRTTSVFAYTTIFGWADVTGQIGQVLPDPSVLEPIENDIYTFFANGSKEPIAAVSLDENDVPGQVTFKRGMSVATRTDKWQNANVRVSPNPTYGKTTLYYSGLKTGEYRLVIFDILGNEIWSDEFVLGENGLVKQDFGFLGKGTYLYSLKDENEENVTTKRLVLIRP